MNWVKRISITITVFILGIVMTVFPLIRIFANPVAFVDSIQL